MTTSDLIEQLSWQAADVRQVSRWGRVWPVALGALATAWVFLAAFPLRPDAFDLHPSLGYGFRLAVLMGLAVGLILGARRLLTPALSWHFRGRDLIWPVAVLAAAALIRLWQVGSDERLDMVLGRSWLTCTLSQTLLALPTLAGLLWMARHWAVTRPRLTGAVLGCCAGVLTAIIYTLHCTEVEPAFVLLWYGLGIATPGWIGAALGQRWLRC